MRFRRTDVRLTRCGKTSEGRQDAANRGATMAEQTEFFKTVREGLTSAQAKATQRFEALEGDARKALTGLVEKGKVSQRDVVERLNRLASSGVINEKVKPAAEEALRRVSATEYKQALEELGKKVRETREKAVAFVDTTGREQAGALAVELHRFADRLEKLAKKVAADSAPATDVH